MDGSDLYTVYGVFALRGSFNDLLKMPSLKEPSSFNWETEDGDDVDLTNRVVEYHDVQMSFLLKGASVADMLTKRNNLLSALKQDGWRVFVFNTLGLTVSMYYKSCEATKYSKPSTLELTLKFRLKTV